MIRVTEPGLFCEAGGFHIDPMRPVETALITHAHSDHARSGSRRYYCVNSSMRLLRHRLGPSANLIGVPYGQPLFFGDVRVSFHPAGHILGSAQIRVEHEGSVWAVSGDYKRDPDPSCEPFEVIRCDTFVTEATFGQPSFRWDDPAETMKGIFRWWESNARAGINSLLFCYALGKTQRVLAGLKEFTDREVYLFGEAFDLTECYRENRVPMLPTRSLERDGASRFPLRGELIIAPHAITRSPWMERLEGLSEIRTAFASGWMKGGPPGIRDRYDHGFVLSDHADWDGLLRTIQETGAHRVLVLHGKDGALIRELRKRGLDASLFTRDSNPNGIPVGAQMNLF